MHGNHFLKMICSTQTPVALSSGEGEMGRVDTRCLRSHWLEESVL